MSREGRRGAAKAEPMRVVAKGRFAGEDVELTWSEADFIQGPRHVFEAIVDKSAALTGTPVGIPGHDVIYGGYLRVLHGFTFVADQVLENARFEYPEGEPPPLTVPEGAIP